MFDGVAVRARELVVGQLRRVLSRLDPSALTGPQAVSLLEWFATVERLAAAGKALVAARAAETNQWRQSGDRSPEHWLARKSGTTVGAAKDALDTARRLQQLPETDKAVRDGKLSAHRQLPWPKPRRWIRTRSGSCWTRRRTSPWPSCGTALNG